MSKAMKRILQQPRPTTRTCANAHLRHAAVTTARTRWPTILRSGRNRVLDCPVDVAIPHEQVVGAKGRDVEDADARVRERNEERGRHPDGGERDRSGRPQAPPTRFTPHAGRHRVLATCDRQFIGWVGHRHERTADRPLRHRGGDQPADREKVRQLVEGEAMGRSRRAHLRGTARRGDGVSRPVPPGRPAAWPRRSPPRTVAPPGRRGTPKGAGWPTRRTGPPGAGSSRC